MYYKMNVKWKNNMVIETGQCIKSRTCTAGVWAVQSYLTV